MNADDLIAQIEAAFAGAEHPGDQDLAAGSYGDEPAALARDFAGRRDWRHLPAEFLDQAPEGWGSALSFFSAKALRFYLPAYLIADVRSALMHVDPSFRLSAFLGPSGSKRIAKVWGGGTMGERARETFDMFSEAEASAIAAYLQWKLDTDPCADAEISEALRVYWLPRSRTNL